MTRTDEDEIACLIFNGYKRNYSTRAAAVCFTLYGFEMIAASFCSKVLFTVATGKAQATKLHSEVEAETY